MVFVEEVSELVNLDLWAGYEFWSAQLDAKMEAVAEELDGAGGELAVTRQLGTLWEGEDDAAF